MTLTTCFSQRILAGRFSDGCAPGPGTEFAPEQIRGTAHPRAVPTASTCCPRSPWTHIWRCEATTGLCTDSAIPPTSSRVTLLAAQKRQPGQGLRPRTYHASLGPPRNYRYGTGRSACNLAPINKERRYSPDVRQSFSDFFPLGWPLDTIGASERCFHRDIGGRLFSHKQATGQGCPVPCRPHDRQRPTSEEIPRDFALPADASNHSVWKEDWFNLIRQRQLRSERV